MLALLRTLTFLTLGNLTPEEKLASFEEKRAHVDAISAGAGVYFKDKIEIGVDDLESQYYTANVGILRRTTSPEGSAHASFENVSLEEVGSFL